MYIVQYHGKQIGKVKYNRFCILSHYPQTSVGVFAYRPYVYVTVCVNVGLNGLCYNLQIIFNVIDFTYIRMSLVF